MTWLPTWKNDANSPISLSFLFISNFKFQIHVHNTFEVSLSLYCSFSSLLCCDSPWRPPRHRRPDEQGSPTPATIEVERSFYNPSDPTSAASNNNGSHSRRLTSESLSVFPPNSLPSTLYFLDRFVCTDVNFKC